MMRSRSGSKRFYLFVSLGAGLLLLAFASLLFTVNRPVQAQDPLDEGVDPMMMAFDPGPMAADQLDIRVSVNYAADLIEEGYEAGHTVWITVTDESGANKATIELETQAITYWATDEPGTWQTGFSTLLGNWVPRQPDIVPGDFVHASSDEGYTTTMKVGEISGFIYPDDPTSLITGTIDAPWLLPTTDDNDDNDVEVKCKAYDPVTFASAQAFDEDANRETLPDGEDVYTCDFAADPDHWNLQPGDLVAVSYDALEPNVRGNRTVNVFAVPGPYLQIKEWAPGSPGIGGPTIAPGNLIINIEYRNEGPIDAANVVIADTMVGLTYLSDTSGFPVSGSGTPGDPLIWDVGVVPAGEHVQFQLFAAIAAGVTQVENDVWITTDPLVDLMGLASQREDTWSAAVETQGSWLTVSKGAWTQNPAPGEDFVYVLDVCNTRHRYPVDSTEATITDTLPLNTSLAGWWSEDGGWSLDSSTGDLVFTRDAIAADNCTAIYVSVTLGGGAQPGDPLCTTSTVAAENNNTPIDYQETEFCHMVGMPEYDLAIDKMWAGGQLVPGGQLVYEVIVRNSGNMPIAGPVTMIDTVPAYATFAMVLADDDAPFSFTLTPQQSSNQLTWEFSDIEAGQWARFWLIFDLDKDVPVGTEITNSINVASDGLDEVNMTDNTASWTEMIYASGPNLRVRKTGEWANNGTSPNRINYRVDIENVGDEGVYDVLVSDVYDDRMRLALDPVRIDLWDDDDIEVFRNGATHSLTADMADNVLLGPGESFGLNFDTWLTTGSGIYPMGSAAPGEVYTNTAIVSPTDRDVNLDDNTAVATNTTGPDLEVLKAYAGGTLQAGEQVTFTLMVRNAQLVPYWWWGLQGNAMLTDTLPPGLSFESAALWRCETGAWCDFPPDVNGQILTWNLGALPTGGWNMIRLVASIDANVADQTDLTNQATVASTDTIVDLEAAMTNNSDEATITILEPGAVYTLNVTRAGQGSVTVNPDRPAYVAGEVVTLTATPASGWLFAGWSGDIAGTDREVTLTMMSNVSATATFAEVAVVLAKSVTPATGVAVGDVVTYTITIDNTGAVTLTDLTLTDVLPAGITFVGFAGATSVTPDPTYAAGTVSWSGDMPAGTEPARIIFTATVNADATPIITNIAEIQVGAEGIAVAQASFTLESSITIYMPLMMRAYMP